MVQTRLFLKKINKKHCAKTRDECLFPNQNCKVDLLFFYSIGFYMIISSILRKQKKKIQRLNDGMVL